MTVYWRTGEGKWRVNPGWPQVHVGYFRDERVARVVHAAAKHDAAVARMLAEDEKEALLQLRADIKRIPLVSRFQEHLIAKGVLLRHTDRAEFYRRYGKGVIAVR